MTVNRKAVSLLLTLALVFSLVFSGLTFAADPENEVNRISGYDRESTAVSIAKERGGTAETVIVANRDNFADGLAASVLAGAKDAPILLTSTSSLHKTTKQALVDLGTKQVYIAGGTLAISHDVKADIEALGIHVERLSGQNRYETAVALAEEADISADVAYIVNGEADADAMVAGVAAYNGKGIILGVKKNSIPDATSQALKNLNIKKAVIIGGTQVVDKNVEEALKDNGLTVTRVSGGKGRESTSIAFAESEFSDVSGLTVVNGRHGIADAIGASALGNPIIYATSSTNMDEISRYMIETLGQNPDASLTVIGGSVVISDAIQKKLQQMVNNAQDPSQATLILKNGSIYTVENDQPTAEAVAIKGKTIIGVGTNEEMMAFQGEDTEVIDLDGKMVLPGFFDSHTHAHFAVEELYTVNLHGLKTVEQYQEALREYIRENPDAESIRGRGWINGCCDEHGPRKEAIDEIIPDIPVILTSEDGHSTWVNSKTLELAGITKDTPDPKSGILERDPVTGEPYGTLREGAQSLVRGVIEDYTVEEYKNGILEFQRLAAERGITSVHVLLGSPQGNGYKAFKELEKEGKLTVRYRGSFTARPERGPEQIEEFIKERDKNQGDHFKTHSVKVFTDGAVEGGTAYLEEPYKHKNSRGNLEWDDLDKFNEVFAAIDKAGMQIHVHSIGDAATRITLDGIQYAQDKNGKRDARHGITHLQLVNEEDFKRFYDLGVVALPQPFWHMKETGYYEEIEVPYLGRERAEREYPMKSFFDAGVVVASGSDYTVTPEFGPLYGIQYGVTRTEFEYGNPTPNDDPDAVANPSQLVEVEDMIASFTINGAYANFLEDVTGSIKKGKFADLVVIDKNLFEIPKSAIHTSKVMLTLFEGKKVYRDPAFE